MALLAYLRITWAIAGVVSIPTLELHQRQIHAEGRNHAPAIVIGRKASRLSAPLLVSHREVACGHIQDNTLSGRCIPWCRKRLNVVKGASYITYFDDMGILKNVRHEAFAQAVANGHSAFKAHEIAGFLPDRANAGRLRNRDDISRRVDEILATRTKAIDKALMSAAERVGLDEEWVLRNLRVNAVMAMRAGDRAAAARSLELIGRHLSMFIDRKSVEISYVDDADEYLAKIMELVGQPVLEHEAPQLEHAANDGRKCGSEQQTEPDISDIIDEIS
jgi:hypothetical protein